MTAEHDDVCLWCAEPLGAVRFRAYLVDNDKLDYCSRDHAELDTSAGPRFRGVRIRRVTRAPR